MEAKPRLRSKKMIFAYVSNITHEMLYQSGSPQETDGTLKLGNGRAV